MWIIPSNHPLSSAFAQEYLASKEGLQELASTAVSWPTWKSKPSSLPTWLRAWNRVFWIPHLFGRMLKPSMHRRFVEEYTESLEVIHALPSASQEQDQEKIISDTFTRLYQEQSKQQDLFGASLKTSMTTLPWDSTRFTKTYREWVMRLRQESTRRKKSARHMRESGYSSWPSPAASDMGGSTREDFSPKLSEQAKKWHTPIVQDSRNSGTTDSRRKRTTMELAAQVQNWPTPLSQMYKGDSKKAISKGTKAKGGAGLSGAVIINGPLVKDASSTNGKSREQLNPAWVAQLMGTTLEKIFFVPLVTASWNKQQK